MAEQQVPWAPGRRALIRPLPTMGWEEARAEVSPTGERIWAEVRPRDALAWADTVPRALLPGQCASCHELVRHAEGCSDGSRCGWACPHGDRCRLFEGHDGGCNHGCPCNIPSARAGLSPEESEVKRKIDAGCPVWVAHVASDVVPEDFGDTADPDLYLAHDDGGILHVCFGDDYSSGEPYAVVGDSGYDIIANGWPCKDGSLDPEWRWFVRLTKDGPREPWSRR